MEDNYSKHTITVLVENEFGVLARIAGMFAARGFNIDALAVAPTENSKISRVTLVTHGHERIIEQIVKQLYRLVDVLKVQDLSDEDCVRCELMLVKVSIDSSQKEKVFAILEEYGGRIVDDYQGKILTLEFVKEHEVTEEILAALKSFKILETVRTGNIAMQKGGHEEAFYSADINEINE